MIITQKNYVDAVYAGLDIDTSKIEAESFRECLYSLFDNTISQQTLDEQVARIADALQGNSKRYKFITLTREGVLNALFEKGYSANSSQVIAAAEQADPTQGSFYESWREICWIKIPKTIGTVCYSLLFKIAVGIAAFALSSLALYSLYQATTSFVTNVIAAKVVPFLINNTPLLVIQLGNKIAAAVEFVFNNPVIVCGAAFIAFIVQEIFLRVMPEIPHLTNAIRSISFWNICCFLITSPQAVGDFISESAIGIAFFVGSQCDMLGDFFNGIAQRAEDERLTFSKQKALVAWNKMIIESAPVAAL